MSVRKYKLTLAFDGSGYDGWQAQRSGRGVRNHVEAAVARLVAGPAELVSSSRTDAGVHAWGLVVHLAAPAEALRVAPGQLVPALNALLPAEIRVRSATRVPVDFHARFGAVAKQYRYFLWNDPVMNPLRRDRAWHVPRPLDPAAMRTAAAHLAGRHDFRAFTSRRAGELGDAVRTLHRCEVRKRGPEVMLLFEGSGFLYKMCRCLAGTLVSAGEGRLDPATIPDLLAAGDRRATGVNAPAHGLVLWRVRYR